MFPRTYDPGFRFFLNKTKPKRGSETSAHHTAIVNTRRVVCERALRFCLPSSAHTYTNKRASKLRQKSNNSIGDRRNSRETSSTHLKTSTSSRLLSLLSFCPSPRFHIPIIGVFKFHHGVSSDLYSADCAHLPHTTCDFGGVCLDISECSLCSTHLWSDFFN